jgi:DNA-binding NarL/FixJ family response regulator
LAVKEPLESVAAVAIAAETRAAQLRLRSALAGWPALELRVVAALRKLIASGVSDDLIVSYHEKLGPDDCESFKHIKSSYPELLVVAVCEPADGRAVRRVLDCGIDGLVFTGEIEAALPSTVAAALAGQIAVPRNFGMSVHKPSLSARERQVLGLLVNGLTNSEISARLFLSESTVKSHLSSAYTKLGVRSRSEAVSVLVDPRETLSAGIHLVRQ